jgi:hypothetical protein
LAGAFSTRADGNDAHTGHLDVAIGRAISRQYVAHPEIFERVLAHPHPVEAIRAEARRADMPLASLLYGLTPFLASATAPHTAESIILGCSLMKMEPDILEKVVSMTSDGTLPDVPSNLLFDSARYKDVFDSLCRTVTRLDYGYELLRAGCSTEALTTLASRIGGERELMNAIVRGVDAPYASAALARGMSVDDVVRCSQDGLPLEYAYVSLGIVKD